MTDKDILKGKYAETVHSIGKDLKNFKDFLYKHFYKSKYYEMYHIFHQAARFFVTAKLHKFDTTEDINVIDLKLRSIIDRTGTCIYDASKVVAEF